MQDGRLEAGKKLHVVPGIRPPNMSIQAPYIWEDLGTTLHLEQVGDSDWFTAAGRGVNDVQSHTIDSEAC